MVQDIVETNIPTLNQWKKAKKIDSWKLKNAEN